MEDLKHLLMLGKHDAYALGFSLSPVSCKAFAAKQSPPRFFFLHHESGFRTLSS